ncbi:MAG: hypothetical protein ABI637_03955 [Gemmatimonadota bacterium]
MGSELGSSQISTLLETLPGIAHVLRSPVADALSHVIRAAARLEEFRLADAEELTRFAVRRSLMGADEADRIVADVQQAQQKRLDKAADRVKAHAQKVKAKARPSKAVPKRVKAKALKKSGARSVRPVKKAAAKRTGRR